jgi:hypothetical protein
VTHVCLRRRFSALATATAFLLLAFAGLTAHDASAQASRTWVSGIGDDLNVCSRTAPCKTFAGAISKTAAGGEIDALDSGGFGAVTITKAITIDGSGNIASALNSSLNGININAGANDDVVIRGLSIQAPRNASAPPACPYPAGQNGINVILARSVSVEDTVIANQLTGVRIVPTAQAVPVTLANVAIRNTCVAGVDVAPSGAGSSNVILQDGRIQGSQATTLPSDGVGLRVGAQGHAFVIRSTIFNNTIGIQPLSGGLIDFYTDSQLVGNGTDGTPTATPGPSYAGPTGPSGATGPSGSPGANGQAGAQGSAGAAAYKLVLALLDPSLTGTSGKKVTLDYIATVNGNATLAVLKGSKTVATIKDNAKAGRNGVAWNGKIKGKAAAAGAYKLKLTVQSADGQKTSQTATVTLKKAR